MGKKNLTIFTALLSSFILMMPVRISDACGWYDPEAELTANIIIAPECANLKSYSPFFLSNYEYYNEGENITKSGDPYEEINLKEWMNYFGGKVATDELYKFIYESDKATLQEYRDKIKSGSQDFEKYPLLKVGAKKLTPVLDYLEIAFAVNKINRPYNDSWGYYEESDGVEYGGPMADEFKKIYAKQKDLFLKQRYAFQLLRFYASWGSHPEILKFSNTELGKFTEKNSIYYRCLGYKAAALMSSENYAEANYIYSLQFDKLPGARKTALKSFNPIEESYWAESLTLAKTPDEKCALWILFGMKADPVRALEEIQKLNPAYAPARLLATRVINITEAGESFYGSYNLQTDIVKFNHVAASFAQSKTVSMPAFWNVMAAYSSYILEKFTETSSHLEKAKKQLTDQDALLKADVYTIEMLIKIRTATKINTTLDKEISDFLSFGWSTGIKEVRAEAIYSHAVFYVKKIYETQGNKFMTALSNNNNGVYYNGGIAFMQEMIDFMKKSDHTPLEKLLIKNYFLTANSLTEEIGLYYLYNHELDKAYARLSAISTDELPGNPFTIHINDCHDCDHMAPQKVKYTKATLVKKLIEMETIVKNNPKDAQTLFLLGNAYYNMTYYGNARKMYETTLFWNRTDYYDYTSSGATSHLTKINDCSLADEFYRKANKAIGTTNREFSAKCIFMTAKCQLNAYYNTEEYSDDQQNGIDFRIQKALVYLKNNYADTKYYQEVVDECGYFRSYLGR